MGQPVRRNIQESHPNIGEEKITTLIVDGTNLLTMSFADNRFNENGIHYGGVYRFLELMKKMMRSAKFDYIYVVFDDENSGILRYNHYKLYKANRDKHYDQHVENLSDYMKDYNETLKRMQSYLYNKQSKEKAKKNGYDSIDTQSEDFLKANFARERNILQRMFEELYIRCIFIDDIEGDDVIAYYVNNKKDNENVVIMSSDRDLTQLLSPSVCIWDQRQKKFVTYKNFPVDNKYISENVAVKKIFCGDTSDNIGNIRLLSEEKFFELMPEARIRPVTVDDVKKRAQKLIDERVSQKKKPLQVHENIINGVSNKEYEGDFYEINRTIIDLKAPLLTKEAKEEIDSLRYSPLDPEGRSFSNVYKIVKDESMGNLRETDTFSSFFADYKAFSDREIKKFTKNQ